MARLAHQGGDQGASDLVFTDVIRRNERQARFVAGRVVATPLRSDSIRSMSDSAASRSIS